MCQKIILFRLAVLRLVLELLVHDFNTLPLHIHQIAAKFEIRKQGR